MPLNRHARFWEKPEAMAPAVQIPIPHIGFGATCTEFIEGGCCPTIDALSENWGSLGCQPGYTLQQAFKSPKAPAGGFVCSSFPGAQPYTMYGCPVFLCLDENYSTTLPEFGMTPGSTCSPPYCEIGTAACGVQSSQGTTAVIQLPGTNAFVAAPSVAAPS